MFNWHHLLCFQGLRQGSRRWLEDVQRKRTSGCTYSYFHLFHCWIVFSFLTANLFSQLQVCIACSFPVCILVCFLFLFRVWLLRLASIFHADRPPLYSSTDLLLGFQTFICLCCPVLVPSSKQRANLAWRVMQNQKMRRINVNDETFNLWGSVGFLNNFTSNQVVVQFVSYLLHF